MCGFQNVRWHSGKMCVSSNETGMIDLDHSTVASKWSLVSEAKVTEGKVWHVGVKCSRED